MYPYLAFYNSVFVVGYDGNCSVPNYAPIAGHVPFGFTVLHCGFSVQRTVDFHIRCQVFRAIFKHTPNTVNVATVLGIESDVEF
jgi:hypothetical protein